MFIICLRNNRRQIVAQTVPLSTLKAHTSVRVRRGKACCTGLWLWQLTYKGPILPIFPLSVISKRRSGEQTNRWAVCLLPPVFRAQVSAAECGFWCWGRWLISSVPFVLQREMLTVFQGAFLKDTVLSCTAGCKTTKPSCTRRGSLPAQFMMVSNNGTSGLDTVAMTRVDQSPEVDCREALLQEAFFISHTNCLSVRHL